MNERFLNDCLSKYNKFILNKIIIGFHAERDFNVYELVRDAVSQKCILPSQNELIMDAYFTIKEYLEEKNFIQEQKEMTSYVLTTKGIELMECGTIE